MEGGHVRPEKRKSFAWAIKSQSSFAEDVFAPYHIFQKPKKKLWVGRPFAFFPEISRIRKSLVEKESCINFFLQVSFPIKFVLPTFCPDERMPLPLVAVLA